MKFTALTLAVVFLIIFCGCQTDLAPETTAAPEPTVVPETTAEPEITAAPEIDDTAMTAMSFNVYVGKMSGERMARVLEVIETHLPDTFGVQEASPVWMRYLDQKLKDRYAYVGVGRDGGTSGEYSAIFYSTEKFDLIDSGTYWLSDTPEQVSKYESSSCIRIFTYALLERKTNGVRVMHVNTHMENNSQQVNVLIDFIKQYPELPIVCTGDFNLTPDTMNYRYIHASRLSDASVLAVETETASTCHAYEDLDQIIDYCFVTDDRIAVDRYDVLDEKVDGEYPSDHHPIMIEYRLIEPTAELEPEGETLKAISFNVYVGNMTGERMARVRKAIEAAQPDTIGLQEDTAAWIRYLNRYLEDEYAYVGTGAEGNGNGEFCAIFYRRDKFNLIDSGTYWLTDTPDTPSKVSSSGGMRVVTYALLERKSDGVQVLYLNTHLDHKGDEPHLTQIRVLIDFLAQYPDTPIVFTGDFNIKVDNSLYRYLVRVTRLDDGAVLTADSTLDSTCHAYEDLYQIIDFCFVSDDRIAVDRYDVLDEKIDGEYPSDHHPIMIEYRVK